MKNSHILGIALLGALLLAQSLGARSSIAQEPLPPTMGPATATPALPEEGGPSGGVLSGHLYVDNDRSNTRSEGDGALPGTVLIELVDEPNALFFTGASADERGLWESRALPDGRYRLIWEPPVRDPADLKGTIPPAEEIQIDERTQAVRVVLFAEVRGASRTYDLDMGIPYQPPLAGPPIHAPNTGEGGSGVGNASTWAFVLGFGAAAVLLIAIARTRRA